MPPRLCFGNLKRDTFSRVRYGHDLPCIDRTRSVGSDVCKLKSIHIVHNITRNFSEPERRPGCSSGAREITEFANRTGHDQPDLQVDHRDQRLGTCIGHAHPMDLHVEQVMICPTQIVQITWLANMNRSQTSCTSSRKSVPPVQITQIVHNGPEHNVLTKTRANA